MQIVVKASALQQKAFLSKPLPANSRVYWYGSDILPEKADIYFDLCYEEDGAAFTAMTDTLVFANAVLSVADTLPNNYVRINAWNGFLERSVTEIVTGKYPVAITTAMEKLGWLHTFVPDVPGMISARIIAMIINEAFFAWGDEVSSKADIDTAMKLGTNYPYGPFEWCEKIGIGNIHQLLSTLSKEDERYTPAPALVDEATQLNSKA
ncbi:MAG: 3-hydroxyacyl-CoA dehydrogenase family protein [Bacteroidota bacterium]